MKIASFLLPFFCAGLVLIQGCSKSLKEDELLKSAIRHQTEDEYDEALADFDLLIKTFPKSEKVPEALFAMGVILQNKKKEYRKAESVFTRLVMNFPANPTAQSAAYQRARIFVGQMHQPDSARAAFEFFLQHYPDAMSAPSARLELDSLKTNLHPAK